ncbi:carbohydrate sulfotransferase 11-like [Mytilus californianus]|uniref:carbohydrate sulfotransferase 11-like n=1 Tax=Mytilus californianus TaxID=6549 RepID=UPI0022451873|nr:carbohydrate sulfotransferase 11-like [Mytilus californianus]
MNVVFWFIQFQKRRSLITERYKERIIHLQQTCLNSTDGFKGKSTDTDFKFNILIDKQHNLFYCQIQKVGTKFIKDLLRKLSQKSKKNNLKNAFDENEWKLSDLNSIMENTDKIMFVREPYSRVLSGYVDKLFAPNNVYWDVTGRSVLANTRDNVDNHSMSCGHDVSFPEFVKYIIKSEKQGRNLDRHYAPLYEHCRPCQISYDFIGKFESFKEDILFLLEYLNIQHGTNITFSDFESETTESRAIFQSQRLFNMRKKLERCVSFYNATMRTWREMQIRGLISIHKQFPFDAEYTESRMTKKDLFVAVKNAISSVQNISKVKAQRDAALIEAFRLVPTADLYSLRRFLKPDCALFNYDSMPIKIFDRQYTDKKSVQYFNLF